MVETQEPFTAKRVQIAMSTYSGRRISVAEYKFYYYDPLEDDIMALYADDYHVSLKADVTQGQIDALRARLDVKDEFSAVSCIRKKKSWKQSSPMQSVF